MAHGEPLGPGLEQTNPIESTDGSTVDVVDELNHLSLVVHQPGLQESIDSLHSTLRKILFALELLVGSKIDEVE